MSGRDRSRIDRTDENLQQWLLEQAQLGVPELVLSGLLRTHADQIEARGYIPRTVRPRAYSEESRESD